MVEAKFECLLKEYATVDFMGTIKWFLGTHFQWMVTPDLVQVHLSQTGFASHLVKDNNIHLHNVMPDCTPYCTGPPVDACPKSDEDKKCPTFIECKRKFRSIVGSFGWLAQSTHPNLALSHSFLSAYFNKSSRSHLDAALLHTYMAFLHSSNTEAYVDAIPSKTDQHHRLTTYSDACWGSQIGNAIREGIQLPLFRFRSMRGAIIFRLGSPITWKMDPHNRTSLCQMLNSKK